MRFERVVAVFEILDSVSSTNEMRRVLSEFFKIVPAKDIRHIVYFCSGRIDSDFAATNIGMADRMVLRSISVASLKSFDSVLALSKKGGDIGSVAQLVSGGRGIDSSFVFSTLHKIASLSGSGSQNEKIKLLADLFSKSKSVEAKYIARIVLGQLRLGFGVKILLDSLLLAKTGNTASKNVIEHAYAVCPDVGVIATVLMKKGVSGLNSIGASLGRPIQSMLCQRVKNLYDIESRLGFPVVVEVKYDGERVQVHKNGKVVTLFSRRLENITSQFPDIVASVKKHIKGDVILDGEIMPVDKEGNLLKFQTLMQRRRKHDITAFVSRVPVCLFLFDILYSGKSLLSVPYNKRYVLLKKSLKSSSSIRLAEQKLCSSVVCIEELFTSVHSSGGEGVIIKRLDGIYEAGSRGWSWVKWKPEYVKGLRDTFDLVVVGAYSGKGRRAGVYGGLLLACYNKSKDVFETFCKIGTGFSDTQLSQLPKLLKPFISKSRPVRVVCEKSMFPDVWFSPGFVVEVAGAEITVSPSHSCARKNNRGLALRFPRLLRYREKKPEQATTTKEIVRMSE